MSLFLYNTLTREKERFEASHKVKLYTCGPTVYDFAHIGNFRTYVFEDLLKRVLRYLGFSIEHVMNITDLDDKTILGAKEKGLSLEEYTEPFTKAFLEDIKTLHIDPANFYPKATEYIPQMIKMIQALQEKGIAYEGKDGSIYFSIQKFPSYGKLSHLCLEDLKEGASERIVQDEYEKENASDFVLWKAYDPKRDGAIFWDSPFGKGRPGWHIECSTMAKELLGEELDIHCGGVDNIFPHHENEIAQSESVTKKPFARFWLHAEHLKVENKKMSKSLGNFFTLRDLLEKGFLAKEIRYMLLQTHYRMPLNFTFQEMQSVKASLSRLQGFIQKLQEKTEETTDKEVFPFLEKQEKAFVASLQDDLNIAKALAILFETVHQGNIYLEKSLLGEEGRKAFYTKLTKWDQVFAFLPFDKEDIPEKIVKLIEEREKARKEKDWARSDSLRDKILQEGFLLEDTPQGMRVKKGL